MSSNLDCNNVYECQPSTLADLVLPKCGSCPRASRRSGATLPPQADPLPPPPPLVTPRAATRHHHPPQASSLAHDARSPATGGSGAPLLHPSNRWARDSACALAATS
uniref:Uncharacterized protein n=1 Tax=Leersia perrieri TaxID=77586 RepID=A0A0D9V3T3_9ORYZ